MLKRGLGAQCVSIRADTPESVNEVGAISLPSNRGGLIVAILSSEQTCPNSVSDEAIADVARAAFEYFAMKLTN